MLVIGEVERALQRSRLRCFEAAKRKGCGAHQFKEDKQVKEISRQAKARHGGEKNQHQGLKVVAPGIDKAPGEYQGE